jgi:hypothetical protein
MTHDRTISHLAVVLRRLAMIRAGELPTMAAAAIAAPASGIAAAAPRDITPVGGRPPANCMFCGRTEDIIHMQSADALAQPGLWACDDHVRRDGWHNWPHTQAPFNLGYPSNPTIN